MKILAEPGASVQRLAAALSAKELPAHVILVYARATPTSIEADLGTSDYSYYFVLREFLPALERLGTVIRVEDPPSEVDVLHAMSVEHGVPCTFLSFTPPHKTECGLACPTIPVFAWEFRDLPTGDLGDGPESDWTRVLGRLGWAITHSQYSADAVRRSMRADFPVESIPAPLWDRFETLRSQPRKWDALAPAPVVLSGSVLDSRNVDLSRYGRLAMDPAGAPSDTLDPPAIPMAEQAEIGVDEVVYTCIFNPYDGRKNWRDVLGVFCLTLGDAEDATLILKLTHSDTWSGCLAILRELDQLSPFRCRVLVLTGFLAQEEYEQLIRVTDYAVNASHGEGQCLPIMEFMSCGRPAIAPTHTAFADYIDASNAFLVESSLEPSVWPHEPRQVFRTLRYRINPETLAAAYEESYRVAKLDPQRYRRMAESAILRLRGHSSVGVAAGKLRRVLTLRHAEARVFGGSDDADRQVGRAALESARERATRLLTRVQSRSPAPVTARAVGGNGVDPRICGLKDAVLSGWYLQQSGELISGFRITPEDRVLDVGCGEGSATHFAATYGGASVVFLDVQHERVTHAIRHFPDYPPGRHLPLVGDATALPLSDGCVTKVVMIDVLEHVEDPARALREMVRVGAPGAQYLISVPDPVAEHLQKDLALPGYFRRPNHIHIFEREEFAELVTSAGLRVEQRRFTGFFWALSMLLFWVAEKHLTDGEETYSIFRPPFHEVVQRWAETWNTFIELPGGAEAKPTFDRLLPKNQIILARKPE